MFIYYRNMRTKDENKIISIHNAIFDLGIEIGYQNLSIAKIAKKANVSPATVYIYYKDKEDMFSTLYLKVKDIIDSNLFQNVNSEQPFKLQLETILKNHVQAIMAYPKESVFMKYINSNPSLISKEAYEEGMKKAAYLYQLYEEGVEKQVIKNVSKELIIAITFGPLNHLLEQHYYAQTKMSEEEINQTIEMSWDAIKA
ncbi:TetR/AcrR family transcriptional regulator [Robertmurraya yapensis]|uniref:TetR/AcrR family transcriptional regulator n=2 Tax=Bacillus yapensis TaxID=2492960 RepID=A0A431VS74_9BACI|nr:TetR/AcrR family transcriptional regulator [Bacillus yapensis]TKS93532.1 TetR family transcriptional regulator [Bacillus yapensis]